MESKIEDQEMIDSENGESKEIQTKALLDEARLKLEQSPMEGLCFNFLVLFSIWCCSSQKQKEMEISFNNMTYYYWIICYF